MLQLVKNDISWIKRTCITHGCSLDHRVIVYDLNKILYVEIHESHIKTSILHRN